MKEKELNREERNKTVMETVLWSWLSFMRIGALIARK